MFLPAYRVSDAARYADISGQTIRNWQAAGDCVPPAIGERERGESLSYLQLVEVAFVAAMRRTGVKLQDIKNAREYLAVQLQSEYPFAERRFKTDGKDIWMSLDNLVAGESRSKLVKVNKGGQIAWAEIVQTRFTEFEYEDDLAVRWHVAGTDSPIVIDPRVSFGAPAVKGIATWAIKGRWQAGESIDDIADDFSLPESEVKQALQFEGIDLSELKAWQ
ncbi:DUF433 domain-containing protein [Ramlibacter henchirensis]|uniref:DUF433 domain-containing protein n=1 Tax=Ramlibacter henchirensis TaxID=204072 RepID=A0A4Z0BV58_9BURK|nr:DUF433 domain-containing protein [Ramlibacter henchirensis]TFZ02731.1 DUF433 domain-containing protein [Ramlibacter henchirensis]